jgi:hypothetical protein
MRIAVTGTHGTGKTTLIDDFAAARPGYVVVPEPHVVLTAQGVAFSERPTTADLEEQLEQSCTLIVGHATVADVIFERCPLDFLAYLEVVGAAEGFAWEPHGRLLPRIARALQALDLVVFVPLRRPDDIAAAIEYPGLRRRVDARLKAMLRDDDFGLLEEGPRVVEIAGGRDRRLARLLAELTAGGG